MMMNISGKELRHIARGVKCLILDVDGVLTDGSIILDGRGNELKSFHVRDGHGIKMLMKEGINVALITGRYSRVVERRAQELGIQDVFQKCFNKKRAYRRISAQHSFHDNEIAYAGDDIVDIPILKICGFPIAVADADNEVKRVVKMVTKKKGGKGAVREICDFLLRAKGVWKDIINEYSET